jgi:hydrogenase maturation protease
MSRTLIAGIGNIFLGDDGFGVEVLQRLGRRPLPAGIAAKDYGIGGIHLAYDLLDDDIDTLIMVDALPTGEPAGTVSLLEVDEQAMAELTDEAGAVDSHAMNPAAVLAALHTLGGRAPRVLVVGCQPLTVQPGIGLSEPVAAAVGAACELAIETALQIHHTADAAEEAAAEEAEEAFHARTRPV